MHSEQFLQKVEDFINKEERENNKEKLLKNLYPKLTDREKEFMQYFLEGATTYKELMQKMTISERAVKAYLQNINNKLDSNGTGLKALKDKIKKIDSV